MPGIGDTNRLASIYDHVTVAGLIYPTLAAGKPVVTAAANWAYGNYAVIVPAGTILFRFHIHSITVESCDQDAIFEVALYHGPTDILVSTIRFPIERIGGFMSNSLYPISSALIGPGEQVRARAASSDGLANQATLVISVCYCIED